MRTSQDEFKNGVLYNGFDYKLQVWVKDGIVKECMHPRLKVQYPNDYCCNGYKYAGLPISVAKSRENES